MFGSRNTIYQRKLILRNVAFLHIDPYKLTNVKVMFIFLKCLSHHESLLLCLICFEKSFDLPKCFFLYHYKVVLVLFL